CGFAAVAAGDNSPPPATPKAPPKAAPAPAPVPKTDPAEAAALAQVLRDLLQKHLTDPLAQSSQNWGHQKVVTVINRHREGLRVWSEPTQEMRNDGVWRRIAVRIPDPEKIT